jgi:hypothetical protein
VCLLTEVASVNVATPVTVSAQDLRASDRGAPDYKPRINFPNPWPGGTWTLRDIVDYDISAVRGLMRATALYRQVIVQNFYDMGARAIEAGYRGGPAAFIVPAEQHDPLAAKKLEELLMQGGVEIHRALEPFKADGESYPAGVDIILMAQPYRAYAKTLLERQNYPVTRNAGGFPERPYDVTGWTLPAQMGVDVKTVAKTFDQPAMSRLTSASIAPAQVWSDRTPSYYVVDARGNGGAIAANRLLTAGLAPTWLTGGVDARGFKYGPGSLVVSITKANARTALPVLQKIANELGLRVDGLTGKAPADTHPIARPRVGLYKSWVENVDEGWTRWVLEQYEFPYKSLADSDIRAGNLRALCDVIILPSLSPDRIAGGLSPDVVPPEYAGGLGDAGGRALKTFVQDGGTLISLDQAGGFAINALGLPVRDLTRELTNDRFFVPGSIVRVEVDPAQPLAYGMSPHTAGFFAFSSVYELLSPADATVAARYADRDVLVSGLLEGEQVMAGRPAVVQVNAGMGRVILMGFPVQYRAQSLATFRLLFNAIFAAK